jgi:hypothetical protein
MRSAAMVRPRRQSGGWPRSAFRGRLTEFSRDR